MQYDPHTVSSNDELRQTGEMVLKMITEHPLAMGSFERDRKLVAWSGRSGF